MKHSFDRQYQQTQYLLHLSSNQQRLRFHSTTISIMTSTSCYSITYHHTDTPLEQYAGFTTDKAVWEKILVWNGQTGGMQFQTGEGDGYVGEYNDFVKEKMEKAGGIVKTSNGQDINKNRKFLATRIEV